VFDDNHLNPGGQRTLLIKEADSIIMFPGNFDNNLLKTLINHYGFSRDAAIDLFRLPAVINLVSLLGSGLVEKGGALYTNNPWISFIYQNKLRPRIPTPKTLKAAMDLYGKITPEMKENLVKHHEVPLEVINQLEDTYKRYTSSPLLPYQRDEEFIKELIKEALKEQPIISLPLRQTIEGRDYRWVQNILPDGRVEWRFEKIPVRRLISYDEPYNVNQQKVRREYTTKEPVKQFKPIREESGPLISEEDISPSDAPSELTSYSSHEIPSQPTTLDKLYNEFNNLGPDIRDRLVEIAKNNGDVEGTLRKYNFTRQTVRRYEKRYDRYKPVLSFILNKK